MPRVDSSLFSVEQRASPERPLMPRSAKIMAGRSERARSIAESPSPTTSDVWPPRWSTRPISRATCGSSSTIRIMAMALGEANVDGAAQMPEGCAEQRTGEVEDRVAEGRDPRRQRVLPHLERQRERDGQG